MNFDFLRRLTGYPLGNLDDAALLARASDPPPRSPDEVLADYGRRLNRLREDAAQRRRQMDEDWQRQLAAEYAARDQRLWYLEQSESENRHDCWVLAANELRRYGIEEDVAAKMLALLQTTVPPADGLTGYEPMLSQRKEPRDGTD